MKWEVLIGMTIRIVSADYVEKRDDGDVMMYKNGNVIAVFRHFDGAY